MNELLENIQIEDLRDRDRELAETIGMDAWRKLIDVYGGTGRMYIPQVDMVVIPIRDQLIRREFNGDNFYELARKWNMTERSIREIVKDKIQEIRHRPIDGQLSFL